MKPKETQSKYQNRISTAVIVVGVLVFLGAGGYWASGYPWGLFLSRLGWSELPDDLPDPAPLPASVRAAGQPQEALSETGALPDPVDWAAARPSLHMTWLGIIKLPKIQLSENIVEGAGDELLYAVGHVRGTAMPGQEGNCVLAGHRNYIHMNPFRHLDKVGQEDTVLLKDDTGQYTYQVYEVLTVGPGDAWVMEPAEGESHVLTLVTCTPVVNPTQRLIVRCRLVDEEPAPQ